MAPHPLQPFSKAVQEALIFQWNARSLRLRISDTRPLVFKNEFTIIVICELRLPSTMRMVIWLCEVFRSVTCNYCSKVIIHIRCELTYVEHAVTRDDNNQYVCLKVKRRNLIFSLIGVYVFQYPVVLTLRDLAQCYQRHLGRGLLPLTSTLITHYGEPRSWIVEEEDSFFFYLHRIMNCTVQTTAVLRFFWD